MITITRLSAWKYDTSASGGVGVGVIAAEGGTIYFYDPSGGYQKFRYGGLGAGFSWGFKIPKIPKIQIKGKPTGGVVAPSSLPSRGALFATNRCTGTDLTKSDIQGACAFIDGGAGLIAGGYAGSMLLGLNGFAVAAALANPFGGAVLWPLALQTARAVLLFGGVNVGIQAGFGGAVFVGALI